MCDLKNVLTTCASLKDTQNSMYVCDYDTCDLSECSLYFGTGLASLNKPSIGFGVEFLNTVFTALWLRKNIGLKKVIHEISTIGYNIDDKTRERLITEEKEVVESMVKNLNLGDVYQLNFSHDYHLSPEFKGIHENVIAKFAAFDSNSLFDQIKDYTTLQIAGMKYLYESEKNVFKLGWITDKASPADYVDAQKVTELINKGHLNEYYFDTMYRYAFPSDLYSFVYTKCAFDLETGNRTAPYTVIEGQSRPVLNGLSILDFVNKLSDTKSKRNSLRAWNETIIYLFEDLFHKINISGIHSPTEEILLKMDYIKDLILK